MKSFLQKIDIKKIAGINGILGIDLNEDRARIVEVQQSLNIPKKNISPYKVLNSFTVNFNTNSSWAEKGEAIKSALAERNITASYAVTSIQSFAIKIVGVNIPHGTRDIDEWIIENQEKLLKYSFPLGQIVHTFEILEETEHGFKTEIYFVRQEEIENYKTALEKAGLKILFLDIGILDALCALKIDAEAKWTESEKIIIFYAQGHQLNIMKVQNGKRISLLTHDVSGISDISKELSNSVTEEEGVEIILAGDALQIQSYPILKPLECSSEYTLAIGLAIRGFSSPIKEKSLLPDSNRENLEASLMKLVFQRTTIFLGSIVLLALLLQYMVDYIIISETESLEEQLLVNGSSYTEIQSLEKQIQELEQQLHGKGALVKSSQYAKFLHVVASALPEGSWLYRIKGSQNIKESPMFSLYGYTESTEKVTEVLRSLNEKKFEVKLIRSGSQLPTENLIPVRLGKNFVTFEIQVWNR